MTCKLDICASELYIKSNSSSKKRGGPLDAQKPAPPIHIPDLPTLKQSGNTWTERLMIAGSFQFPKQTS